MEIVDGEDSQIDRIGGGPDGRAASTDARARLSALVTASSVSPSSSAASLARYPRTSRSSSTARWFGGSSWTAVTNASEMVSRDSYRASGPGA